MKMGLVFFLKCSLGGFRGSTDLTTASPILPALWAGAPCHQYPSPSVQTSIYKEDGVFTWAEWVWYMHAFFALFCFILPTHAGSYPGRSTGNSNPVMTQVPFRPLVPCSASQSLTLHQHRANNLCIGDGYNQI